MSQALIILFAIINGLLIYDGLRKRSIMGVFRFPFIIACVNLTFIYPQLSAIYEYHAHPDGYMSLSLVHMCLCTIAVWSGFQLGNNHHSKIITIRHFKTAKIIPLAVLFLIIGATAYFMNRGVYKGGKISGTYVIINFFNAYINYALVLIMIALYKHNKTTKQIAKFLLIIVLIISIDQFTQQARRGSALYIALIIGYFYMLHLSLAKYKIIRFLIPGIFIFGQIFNTVITQYRSNAYAGELNAIENVESLSFDDSNSLKSSATGEVNNAILGINALSGVGIYDLGANSWNAIVATMVPKALVGERQKEAMILPSPNQDLMEYLTRSGSTMTGFYDSYVSFGLFGFIKFFVIAWFMGALWKKRLNNDISIFLYITLLTPGIHMITHSTNTIISHLVIYAMIVYPVLCNISIKTKIVNQQ